MGQRGEHRARQWRGCRPCHRHPSLRQPGTRTRPPASMARCRTAPFRIRASTRRIQLEHLNRVLFIGRPAFGQPQSQISLFKVDAYGVGHAKRVTVKLGRSSVDAHPGSAVLAEGYCVILLHVGLYGVDRIRPELSAYGMDDLALSR